MSQSQRLLIIEVRTVDSLTDYDRFQVDNIILHRDPERYAERNRSNNYYLSLQQLWRLKAAIIDAIPRLGSNYRHPLLFDTQVVSGDEADSIIASILIDKRGLPLNPLGLATR